jgi:hypothetical protein
MKDPWAIVRRFFGGPVSGERRAGGPESRDFKAMKKMEYSVALPFSEDALQSLIDRSIEPVTYREHRFVLRFGEKTLIQWRAMLPVGSWLSASRLMDEEIVEALDGIFGGHEVLNGDDIEVNSEVLKFFKGEFVTDERLNKSPIPPAILTYKIGSQELSLLEACRRNPKFAVETIQHLWGLFIDAAWKVPRKLRIEDADESEY